MPHHDRRKPPTGAAVESVHVASADAACTDANQQLIFSRPRHSHVNDVEILVLRQNQRLHSLSPFPQTNIRSEGPGFSALPDSAPESPRRWALYGPVSR